MQKPTLVILAAGMGSRYGGLKQLDTFTEQAETLIDFSLFDAIEGGFGKIVFVIRKHFKEQFETIFVKKIQAKIDVEFVYQELDAIPTQFVNENRVKPWGTGHALLMVKDVINENFAVINADDFYGKEAFKIMAFALQNTPKNAFQCYMMGYQIGNTTSKNGSVSRGECIVDVNQNLVTVIEQLHIFDDGKNIFSKDENGIKNIPSTTIVSMNFWGFTPHIFEFLEKEFYQFLEQNATSLTNEFYLPVFVNQLITSKITTVKVLTSTSKWIGVTYPEDKPLVINTLAELKKQHLYPEILWS